MSRSILGAGENLNEHVVGQRWPAVGVRHEMLSEAVEVIGALFDTDAGFDEVALVQIGSQHQDVFIAWAEGELLPALRSL